MKQYLFFVLMVFAGSVSAQWQDVVIFEIEGDSVTAGEFSAVYNKNRDIGQEIDPKTPLEYLELYLNFKLKVKEAESRGLDTLPQVKNEFNSYRSQLAKPYLMDKRTDEKLVYEAYERSKTDVRASHIMIKVDENASPSDTLKAYNKIVKIKSEINDDASNFGKLAAKYSEDDYSAARNGDLGYFNVFDMVYPFESAAYRTDVNRVSKPVRSRFGYHLVMPTDKRIARGTIKVAHIMTIANDKSTTEQKEKAEARIREVYKKVQAGDDFATLARQFSEDKNTAGKGGELQPFGINDMINEFEEAAFAMDRVGDISEPIKTPYGWHIIKILDRPQIPTFESVKSSITQKVQRDERSNLTRQNAISKLKREYNFSVNERNLARYIQSLPGDLAEKGYDVPDNLKDAPLFELNGKSFGVRDFARHISKSYRTIQGDSKEGLGRAHFAHWSDQRILDYENSKLEEKYPDFRYLVQEYRNGILLFELLEEVIWRPSMTDTAGLEAFFATVRDSFQLPERAQTVVYSVQNKKVAKKLAKRLDKGKNTDKIIQKALKSNALAVSQEDRLIDKGTYSEVDKIWNRNGKGAVYFAGNDDMYLVVEIKEVLPSRPMELEECWGAVSALYQKELEKRWVENLKDKFSYTLFEANFKKVEPKINQ
ncbi:MAG: peptidylprolyl isomerase [Cryomorphaceae bacterium]|nr:peptidylprolyl isomerase [Cryomorphaceae bacterium]